MNNILKVLLMSLLLVGFALPAYAAEAKADDKIIEDYMPSLITKTPLEGRMLAIKTIPKSCIHDFYF